MRRLVWPALVAALMIPGIAVAAGKLAVDPNSSEGKPSQLKKEMPDFDRRLLQKVTYDSGYARLHTVLEQLSEKTGVKVRCARNVNDWQVRDIPVVVCAKDMPLWDLLHTIADSTHLVLSYDKAGDTWFYRIWRDAKTEKLLAKSVTDKQEAAKATDSWAWDALAKLAEAPDSAIDTSGMDDLERRWTGNARDLGKLVTALGPEVKDRTLAGDKIGLRVDSLSPGARSAMESIMRREWSAWRKDLDKLAANNPGKGIENAAMDDQRLSKSLIEIRPSFDDIKQAHLYFSAPVSSDITLCSGGTLAEFADIAAGKAKGVDIPKRPFFPGPNELGESILSKSSGNLKLLKTKDDWESPMLKAKVKLEKPAGKKDWPPAEVITALSKASGCSIICEDFRSHRAAFNYIGKFDSETTVGEILNKLPFVWLTDEKHKLIVGWASGWCDQHIRLVPASLIENLKAKLNGDGAEIDDLTPVAYLTWDQHMEWLRMTRGLEGLGWGMFTDETRQLWQFYDALSPQDKARAKSEKGLDLSEFDRRWLSAIFAQWNSDMLSEPAAAESLKKNPEMRNQIEIPTDPEQIALLTLRIKKRVPEMVHLEKEGHDLVARPKDFKKHVYDIEISGETEGRKHQVTISGPLSIYFPAYSPGREAELANAEKAK